MNSQSTKKVKIPKATWAVIILLFLLTVISNADKAVIGFASVPIIDELGLSSQQWGTVGSAFFFLYSISAILVGALADKIGMKKVIAGMAAVWAIVQFSTIFVTSYGYLLITRIILGAGEGPSYSLAMAAASRYLPKEKLGVGLTLVSVGGPLGVAISAPILMSLIHNYGWRSAFLATAIVGVIWIVFWMMLVKEKKEEAGSPETSEQPAAEAASVPETSFKSALLSRNFILIAFCGFATYWSFTIGLNWLPNYLENVRQLNAETLALVVAMPWVMITLSQLTFSSLSDRIYHKTKNMVKGRVFILGPIMVAGAVSYVVGSLAGSDIAAIVLLSLGLTFGCITLVLGPAILVDLVDKKHQGKIQGWFMAFTSLGGIVGPYVTGILVGNSATQAAGFHYSFQLCGLMLLIFGGLVWLAVRPKKTKAEEVNVLVTEEA
ncbi:MFS transporter [Bhargavaea ginsengi]|uniref:MFS transporter n=1 Tax=Bhargavaea ginsengi TaxID=426757 RepID=UPI00203D3D54|nr:MFS transporter [Bhargavaea ginsengi]MCM3087920.1 MFS transporter [Bhargavaea ginsengi]